LKSQIKIMNRTRSTLSPPVRKEAGAAGLFVGRDLDLQRQLLEAHFNRQKSQPK